MIRYSSWLQSRNYEGVSSPNDDTALDIDLHLPGSDELPVVTLFFMSQQQQRCTDSDCNRCRKQSGTTATKPNSEDIYDGNQQLNRFQRELTPERLRMTTYRVPEESIWQPQRILDRVPISLAPSDLNELAVSIVTDYPFMIRGCSLRDYEKKGVHPIPELATWPILSCSLPEDSIHREYLAMCPRSWKGDPNDPRTKRKVGVTFVAQPRKNGKYGVVVRLRIEDILFSLLGVEIIALKTLPSCYGMRSEIPYPPILQATGYSST